jgi:hypothetical protein
MYARSLNLINSNVTICRCVRETLCAELRLFLRAGWFNWHGMTPLRALRLRGVGALPASVEGSFEFLILSGQTRYCSAQLRRVNRLGDI